MSQPQADSLGPTTADLLAEQVTAKVEGLQRAYLPDEARAQPEPWAAATMARLRRTKPDAAGSDLDVWSFVTEGLNARLLGRGDEPSRAERAAHAVLVLYAVHQQSRGERLHRRGESLGKAAAQLGRVEGASELDAATVRRFKAIGVAASFEATIYHLRSFVTLMRNDAVPLDYGRLARDLYLLQDPRRANGVRLQWGRDLHRRPTTATPDSAHPHP